jgi:hypothetical protein
MNHKSCVIATVCLALPAAACGGSSGTSNAGGATNSHSLTSQALAFAHCMRSHGVSSFPDPNSNGVFDKPVIYQLAGSNPRFQAATHACGHLLPDGGPGVSPSTAVVQQIQSDMVKFAACMRSHGVSTWPDPTLDRGRAIFDPQAAGIDPSSPGISTKIHGCERVFPTSVGIPPGA